MKLKKIFPFIIIFFVMSVFFLNESFSKSCPATAAACGTPETYKMTLNKLEFSQNAGLSWITIADTPRTFDLASVAAGQSAGDFIPQGTQVPRGRYNRVRPTVSSTFTIKGKVEFGGACYYTVSSGTSSVAGSCPASPSGYGEASFTVPGAGATISPEDVDDFEVLPGQTLNEAIYVDVTNTLELIQVGPLTFQLFPGEPVIDSTDD